nr:MAG TPA: hypothetical protein [Caudoviricetes sp.]
MIHMHGYQLRTEHYAEEAKQKTMQGKEYTKRTILSLIANQYKILHW